MKLSLKFTLAVMILFFASMAALTFTAGYIHDSRLPKVETVRAVTKMYTHTVTLASGSTHEVVSKGKEVPAEAYRDGGIFIVVSGEKYGRESFFVQKIEAEVATEEDGLVILKNDVTRNRRVVVECTEEMYDGMEVAVK